MGEGYMFTKLTDGQFYKLSCIEEPALPRISGREDPRPCSKPRIPWRIIPDCSYLQVSTVVLGSIFWKPALFTCLAAVTKYLKAT